MEFYRGEQRARIVKPRVVGAAMQNLGFAPQPAAPADATSPAAPVPGSPAPGATSAPDADPDRPRVVLPPVPAPAPGG